MMNFIGNLRYEYPKIFASISGLMIAFLGVILFLEIPPSPIMRAIGISGLQQRVSAGMSGIYWSFRANAHRTEDSEVPVVVYGTLLELDRLGNIVINLPLNNNWVKHKYILANAQITDLYAATSMVGSLRGVDVKLDTYTGGQVVIWVRNVPLNLKLIEMGVATPVLVPPSSIFDKAFATYYWSIANGDRKEQS